MRTCLLAFIFLTFAANSVGCQPAHQKVVQNSTNVSYEEIDDEGYPIDSDVNDSHVIAPPTPASKLAKAKILPKAEVILPIRRKDTSLSKMDVAPCGGVNKKKADTLTNSGSKMHVIWETINPVYNGNCTVRISPGLDQSNFTLLTPIHRRINEDSQFPCGRTKGFESEQFKLPEDFVCDQCTLQWAWSTEEGTFYSCSDMIINGNKIEDCIARCKNGGACFNGKCLCKDNFYGEFCEYDSKCLFEHRK